MTTSFAVRAFIEHRSSPARVRREYMCLVCGEMASTAAGIDIETGEFVVGRVQHPGMWPMCRECMVESRFEFWVSAGAPFEFKSRAGRRRARRVREHMRRSR